MRLLTRFYGIPYNIDDLTNSINLPMDQPRCCTWGFGISSAPQSHDQAAGQERKAPLKL